MWAHINLGGRRVLYSRLRACSRLGRRAGRPGARPIRRLRTLAKALLVVPLVLFGASVRAPAQEVGLGRTLPNIERTHTVRIGYREASPPFSYLDQAGRPIGYSIDLCKAIVEEIGAEVRYADLKIDYVKVTPETRIPALLHDKIDLECGSTTASPDRARRVAFSPLLFIAGTKLMVPKASQISGITDLKGMTVVVTRGTTNEHAVAIADQRLSLGLVIVATTDHEQSYQLLANGKAQAFITDDILLYGLIARHNAQDRFKVVGDYLSYEPYGIMFRKGDAELADVVERTFRRLATNHDLVPLYRKWLMDRLPTGERLDVPLSAELAHLFKMLDESNVDSN